MNNYLNKILNKKNKKKILILFFFLFSLILTIRYLGIHLPFFLGNLALSIDEAQYLTWSNELSFGYFSKPPFIAWILSINQLLLGKINGVELRNLQPLAFAISSIFIFLSSYEITKKNSAAIWSGCIFFLLPYSSFYSQFATTDAWLTFFWSIALYFFIKAVTSDQKKWWFLSGVTVGLGLLTKYSMVFFLFSAFIYLASKKRIFTKNPWISFLVSILVFSPNIIWNFQQNFPTVIHHAEMTNVDQQILLSFNSVVEFFFGQFILFGPLLFLFFLFISCREIYSYFFLKKMISFNPNKNSISGIPYVFSWTILIFVMALSFFGETEINWAAPSSVGICLAITTFIYGRNKKTFGKNEKKYQSLLVLSLVIHIVFLFCLISGPKLFKFSDQANNPKVNPFLQVEGYQELVTFIQKKIKEPKAFLIVSKDRGILANMSIHFPKDKVKGWKTGSQIKHHWDLTQPLTKNDLNKQILMVIKVNSLDNEYIISMKKRLESYFDKVKRLNNPELDKIILQGKKNQKVVLFWINPN